MSNTFKIKNFFWDLPDIFTGSFTNKSSFIKDIKNEMFDISDIPGFKNDKTNLKSDFDNFLKDIKKAQTKIEEENY